MKTDIPPTGALLLLALLCGAHAQVRPSPATAARGASDYLDLRPDGGYSFGYNTGDLGQHQHAAVATPDNRVKGRYSERGQETIYTAGPRGFRARGTHIARRMDLSQTRIPYNPPVNPDSPAYRPTYSGYHDPNEDPSYSFGFRTPTHTRQETSNRNAEVTGQYTFVDDVGERHQVDYIAGPRTGFHVKSAYPDNIPYSGALFLRAPGKLGQKARGRTSVQRGLDGSYRFTAAGPDQRRVEVSDATGHVRGSYTYLDDKGVQRTTEYIAGPNIGYKVISSKKGPVPSIYPYLPSGFSSPLPPVQGITGRPLLDDVFDLPEGLNTAESGAALKPPKKGSEEESIEDDSSSSDSDGYSSGAEKPSKGSSSAQDDPFLSPDRNPDIFPTDGYGSSEDSSGKPDDDDDLFGKPGGGFQKPGGGYDKPGHGFTKPNTANDDLFGSSLGLNKPATNGYGPPGGGYNEDSGSESSSSVEDENEDDLFGKPSGGVRRPSIGGGKRPVPSPTHDDDLFGPTPSGFDQIGSTAESTGGNGNAGKIPGKDDEKMYYGNCCPAPSRGSVKYHNPPTRKPNPGSQLSDPYSHVRDFSYNIDNQALVSHHGSRDGYVGFPPGVAVRAHVQSLDILPYGHRLPSPTVALEHIAVTHTRRSSDSRRT